MAQSGRKQILRTKFGARMLRRCRDHHVGHGKADVKDEEDGANWSIDIITGEAAKSSSGRGVWTTAFMEGGEHRGGSF
jgi:hypothetical protein